MTGAAGGPGDMGAGRNTGDWEEATGLAERLPFPVRMDAVEARRHAVAMVRALVLGDREAMSTLLDVLDPSDDPLAQTMLLTSLTDIAAAALDHLTDHDHAMRLLDHLTQHAEAWPAGTPIPWMRDPQRRSHRT